MAKINFSIKIKDIEINSYMILRGQQLYFYNQGDNKEKEKWIRSHLQNEMKISNIEQIEEK